MVSHNVLFWCGYELKEMALFSLCGTDVYVWSVPGTVRMVSLRRGREIMSFRSHLPPCSYNLQQRDSYIQGWQEEEMGLETLKGRRKGAWCPWGRKLMWCRWKPPKPPNMKGFMKRYLSKGGLDLQAYWKVNCLRQDRSPQRDIYISLKINSKSLMVIVSGPWLLFILLHTPVLIWWLQLQSEGIKS